MPEGCCGSVDEQCCKELWYDKLTGLERARALRHDAAKRYFNAPRCESDCKYCKEEGE